MKVVELRRSGDRFVEAKNENFGGGDYLDDDWYQDYLLNHCTRARARVLIKGTMCEENIYVSSDNMDVAFYLDEATAAPPFELSGTQASFLSRHLRSYELTESFF